MSKNKKKIIKPRIPRTMNHFTMSDSMFWSWLRSQIRKLSMRWIPISECKKASRIPYEGDNNRRKWSYICGKCKKVVGDKECAVHHIEPAGKLSSWDDLPGFCKRLFCEIDGLILLCDECHTKEHNIEKIIKIT